VQFGTVFRLVLREGRTLTAIGASIGVATIVVVGIALAATVIPAYRAARLDPARVLRSG